MPASTMPVHQDWRVVTFKPHPAAAAPAKALKDAQLRSGEALAERRANPAVTATGLRVAALDNATETAKTGGVTADLRLAIMRARVAKGLTQKALATMLNVPVALVNEYESGKVAMPSNATIAKLERALGAKLPRVPKRN